MKAKWICAALLMFASAIPGAAEVSIFIGVPPPAVVYEAPSGPPGPGFFWVEGYWVPVGHHYRWCRGHWDRPPYEGAAWVRPRYERMGNGWRYHECHWGGRGHDNGNHYGWDRGRGHGHDDGDRGRGHGHGHDRD